MMNILVTGGAGFIASHVADAFVEAGHRVTIVDDLSTGRRTNVNPRATFFEMDIRDPGIERLLARERFEVLCHHAAQVNVRRSVADPVGDAGINVVGSLRIFEQARRAGVKRLIFASSGGAIYGEQDRFPADEDHPQRPVSPYGVAKLAAERYLACYRVLYGLDTVALRYANVYGPRQSPHGEAGVVAIFAHLMSTGGAPVINGDGGQTRDYVYVGDVVRANLLALDCRGSRTYNVGTGIENDVTALFRTLRDLLRPECPEVHGPAMPGEQRRSCIDPSLIGAELGWKPAVSLVDGLRMTAAYYRERREAA